MAFKILAVFVLASFLTSSHAEAKKMKMRSNVKAMKAEVLKRVPIGSSIEYAKDEMEKNGFQCKMMWNESFADHDDKGNNITRKGMDFLYCDKEKMVFPLILRRWQIVIVHQKGIVSEVVPGISVTGP